METLKIFIGLLLLSTMSIVGVQMTDLGRLNVSNVKWQWIRSKIYETERQDIDFVFIGSSRTWCAIKSKQIETALDGVKVWNFGRHWAGRDIDYFIVRDLLANHNVKNVMLETIGHDTFKPHKFTKFVISPGELYNELVYHLSKLNKKDYFTYSSHFKGRLKHIVNYTSELSVRLYRLGLLSVWDMVMHKESDIEERLLRYEETGGFYTDDQVAEIDYTFYERYKDVVFDFPVKKGPIILPPDSYPDYYLQKIKRLSDQYQSNLAFVFVSDYGAVLPSDQVFNHLSQMGDVYIPNLQNIYNLEYWRDVLHVYQEGAIVFTDEIISLLQNGIDFSVNYRQYEQYGLSK